MSPSEFIAKLVADLGFLGMKQFVASLILGLGFLGWVVRLLQTGRLEISYCWLWLGIGVTAPVIVLRYDWLRRLSHFLGIMDPLNTLFLLSLLILFLLNMQSSVIISTQRKQIKRLVQEIAVRTEGT